MMLQERTQRTNPFLLCKQKIMAIKTIFGIEKCRNLTKNAINCCFAACFHLLIHKGTAVKGLWSNFAPLQVGESGGIKQCFCICGGKWGKLFDFGHASKKRKWIDFYNYCL